MEQQVRELEDLHIMVAENPPPGWVGAKAGNVVVVAEQETPEKTLELAVSIALSGAVAKK